MSCSSGCSCKPSCREPNASCVFCEIVAGRSPTTKVLFENNRLLIIQDIRPASDHHYLAIPKEHIRNATSLTSRDRPLTHTEHLPHIRHPLVQEMETELRNVFEKSKLDPDDASFGFHWPPFTVVPHLHMHGIAPVSKMSFLARWIFKPFNLWYCTPQYVAGQLKSDCNCGK